MSPTKSLELLAKIAQQYKGTFDDHAAIAEATVVLIKVLKDNQLWEQSNDEGTVHA